MDQEIKKLIGEAVAVFEQATGMRAEHQKTPKMGENEYPDGLIRIIHQNAQWDFAFEVKRKLTRAMVANEAVQTKTFQQDCVLVTEYVTPPIADLMKKAGLFFMDTVGNVYLNQPPLFVFIKGNKPAKKLKTVATRRVFKTAGLKVVFLLLNIPETADWPYRQIAATTDVALGTVDWIFRDLKEMGFLVEMGKRKRKVNNLFALQKRWVEAYPDLLRPKLLIGRFRADNFNWWQGVDIAKYDACWGGEVAAAKLTNLLKPEKIVIYADKLPAELIIKRKLRKEDSGNIEILKPFWKFNNEYAARGIAPPLLVYADLLATGDDRNIETAEKIYDDYLIQPGRQNR